MGDERRASDVRRFHGPCWENEGQEPPVDRPIAAGAAFEGSAGIAEARDMARDFLVSVQAVRGSPVLARAMGMVQLVVSELVTNARKYAPGPCLLAHEISEGAVKISVGDSSTALPSVQGADPERIGQHRLEIVMAVSQTFCVHREPVGKRITAAIELADEPGGDPIGRQPS
jgi:anti-sigma regulatory factor (Ser/Thr protein kinase)